MKPFAQVLSDSEIYQIHIASMELLSDVGFAVHEDEALDIYEKGGAIVDRETRVAKFPVQMVNEALAKCNPYINLYNTDNTLAMAVGGENVYMGTVGYASYGHDWRNDVVRETTCESFAEVMRVCEVLPYPQFMMYPGCPTDIPIEKSDRYQAKIALLNSKKPCIPQSYGRRETIDIIEMAAIAHGGMDNLVAHPSIAFLITCTSPLVIRLDAAETIIESAKLQIPLAIESGPMIGATSPLTRASGIALQNAEVMAHIILAKLVNPLVPIIYGSWCRLFDMRFGNVSLGCPELALMRVANAQMARYYRLPVFGGGCLSDVNSIDAQLGWEKMLTSVVPALGHCNMISGMGMIGQEDTFSCECMVLDNEVAEIVMHLLKGFKIDEEHLALDVIREIGHGGTQFVSTKHTKRHYKEEVFLPKLSDRSVPAEWVNDGAKNVSVVAKEQVAAYLEKWERPDIPDDA
ncbi:MAG: trimethylamine methyltransferase family protein, partial [Eggerthellaceae bacterium]|nr:trimethylamine methyltransferase family protein [Eggerthellaceae bacterium]